MPSFDQIQRDAVLVKCAGCPRSFYMTVPYALCAECRNAQPILKREPKVDVSGNGIEGP
jgi:hypothetical protein